MHNLYEKLCAMNMVARKHELFDTANAIRLASKGDMLPHYNSTRGITLFRTDKRDDYDGINFFFLHWTNWQNEQSHLTSCTEEQAFQFLYDLYGSRYTDITDEELDYMLNQYFPNRTIAGMEEGQQEEQRD
jgi:hypothetical protein